MAPKVAAYSSNLRIIRVRRSSVAGTEEVPEVDLELGPDDGALIHAIEFLAPSVGGNAFVTGTTGMAEIAMHMSVHVETGTLESGPEIAADDIIYNSEIIAETSVTVRGNVDDAANAYAVDVLWGGPQKVVFRDLIGTPFLVARNIVARFIGVDYGDGSPTPAFQRASMRLWIEYVRLSQAQKMNLFLTRR